MDTGTTAIRVRGAPFPIQFNEWVHKYYYHTVEFAAADTQMIRAFVGGPGAAIPGGTRALERVDTNVERGGDVGLPLGREALIYSVQVEIVREMATAAAVGALADTAGTQESRPPRLGGQDPAQAGVGGSVYDLGRKIYTDVKINTKSLLEGPLRFFPTGPTWNVFASTNAGQEVAGFGVPSPRDQRAQVIPLWLRQNIPFVVELSPVVALETAARLAGGAGAAGWHGNAAFTNIIVDLMVRLDGLAKLAVV